jgi:hypothetical protein
MAGQNYCVVGGFLLSLSLCRRGFQDLLKVRPSSLFILCVVVCSVLKYIDLYHIKLWGHSFVVSLSTSGSSHRKPVTAATS